MREPNLPLKGAIVGKFGHIYLFAQFLNIHPATVSHVIAGSWALKPERKKLWAKVLGRPVAELFPETEN